MFKKHGYVDDSVSTDKFKNILRRLDFSPIKGNKLPSTTEISLFLSYVYRHIKKLVVLFSFAFISACGADNATDQQWRALDLNNTVLLTLPHGKVVIELAPQFSPKHVAQFSTDKNWSFTPVQTDDLFAAKTGFKAGFALATDNNNSAWLTHCPGTLAMARGNEADSASSHFYFVIGQAPRYLDKIMTIFGRVVYGMAHIQAIQRTSVIEGEYAIDSREYTPIVSMKLMADVPVKERIIIEVENTESAAFAERLVKRRARENEFFYQKPPPVLDVCQVPVRSRLVKSLINN